MGVVRGADLRDQSVDAALTCRSVLGFTLTLDVPCATRFPLYSCPPPFQVLAMCIGRTFVLLHCSGHFARTALPLHPPAAYPHLPPWNTLPCRCSPCASAAPSCCWTAATSLRAWRCRCSWTACRERAPCSPPPPAHASPRRSPVRLGRSFRLSVIVAHLRKASQSLIL